MIKNYLCKEGRVQLVELIRKSHNPSEAEAHKTVLMFAKEANSHEELQNSLYDVLDGDEDFKKTILKHSEDMNQSFDKKLERIIQNLRSR